jgi:site-specific DNA-methyltransferase (adenine-specific)
MWNGMMQGKSLKEGHIMQGNKNLNEKKIHPTQKPVLLYKWLLKQYATEGDNILDTHVGSGSSRLASYDLGFDYTGFEINPIHWKRQELRFKQYIAQQRLF